MKFRRKLRIALLLLYCRLFRKRIPLFLSWEIGYKCNLHCKYCDIPLVRAKELTTEQVFRIIDDFVEMGTCVVIFTGGEPLLRRDIGKIVDYCKEKGLYLSINSNGLLVKEKINDIKNIDLLQLSFDGPPQIHDFHRGKGSYEKVMEAIRIAKENGIKVTLSTTLSNHTSLSNIDYLLDIAKKYNVKLRFQLVVKKPLASKNVGDLCIPKEKRKEIFNYILKKRRETGLIENTRAGLVYFRDYSGGQSINCGAFRINCLIAPNGDIYPCTYLETKIKPYNCEKIGFKEAFRRSKPITCTSCLCNKTLDASKLFSLDFTALIDIIKSSLT